VGGFEDKAKPGVSVLAGIFSSKRHDRGSRRITGRQPLLNNRRKQEREAPKKGGARNGSRESIQMALMAQRF